jgi:hypothetical protein
MRFATGSNNCAFGYNAGYNINSNGNVCFGNESGKYTTTASNEFFINNQDRTNYAGDQTKSLIYGKFAATAAAQRLTINASLIGGSAALATTATDGFWYVPSCAGLPTGVPTAQTGTIPIVADSTNNKLYIYSGGAWVALN